MKRVPVAEYAGNGQYADSARAGIKYCFGHCTHRSSLGGRTMGKLKLFYCAECVAKRLEKKGTT